MDTSRPRRIRRGRHRFERSKARALHGERSTCVDPTARLGRYKSATRAGDGRWHQSDRAPSEAGQDESWRRLGTSDLQRVKRIMWRIDEEMRGSSPTKLQVLDADGGVVATIASSNAYVKFRRAWAAEHEIRTTDVALVVTCEGGGCQILDSKSAFREFSAGKGSNVRNCRVAVSSTLPDVAPQDLRDDQEAYECWRLAA